MTVVQELTLIATLMAFVMLAVAILCVFALMGALHLGLYLARRKETRTFTTNYSAGRYGEK